MSRKHQLLDPIASLNKLVLLNFYPVGTRIHIKNNRIHLDPPHKGQSVERFIYGDSRSDISVLGSVISRYIKHYLEPRRENETMYRKLKTLGHYSCTGLKKLQLSYYEFNNKIHDNCTYTLQYFIDTLSSTLRDDEGSVFKIDKLSHADNLLDEEKMKGLWRDGDIDQMYRSFVNCFDDSDHPLERDSEGVSKNILVIETFLQKMDENFAKLVQSTNAG